MGLSGTVGRSMISDGGALSATSLPKLGEAAGGKADSDAEDNRYDLFSDTDPSASVAWLSSASFAWLSSGIGFAMTIWKGFASIFSGLFAGEGDLAVKGLAELTEF
jgi:hypothetical protein